MTIYIWILMPTACVDPTLGNDVKDEFNRVGYNSVQFCANPCPLFMVILIMQGYSFSTGGLLSLCVSLHCIDVYKSDFSCIYKYTHHFIKSYFFLQTRYSTCFNLFAEKIFHILIAL